jgi:acyl carrier protein
VATRGTADITGSGYLRPERAPMLAAARILPQELPRVRCRVLDLWDDADLGAALCSEVGREGPPHVAYRGGQRWTRDFTPAGAALPPAGTTLREDGVYLILGGLGGIGLDLAEHLSRRVRARLVLTSRSGLVAREEWDEWLSAHRDDDVQSRRIKRIRAMEASGATVELVSADVADRERMAHVIERTHARFGALHGVFHAAGSAGQKAFRAAQDTEPEHCAAHFRSKVQGVDVLAEVLPDGLDFVLLLSSLSTAVGGAGLLAYAAANHHLDAFAVRQGAPWSAVGLDAWGSDEGGALAAMAMPASEGVELIERIAGRSDARHWVVSTVPLARRIAEVSQARPVANQQAAPGKPVERHARPQLGNEYVAPRNEVEEAVAATWEEVLGTDGIGVEDNFFKLGGDSLMAIQIGTRLRDSLGVEIPINELFEDATVAAVARAVEKARGKPADDPALAAQLALVESLSDDQVRRMLAELEGGQ